LAEPKSPSKQKREVAKAPALPDEETAESVLERLGDLIPAENRQRAAVIIEETISSVSHHSGPLPPPSDLAAYETIQPGFAERIMQMAEKEQTKRHVSLDAYMEKEFSLKSRAQHYSMVAIVLLPVFAAFLAHLGDTKAAAAVICVGLLGIVGAFVTGKMASIRSADADPNIEDK
jgi:uncharacterized membrane protein